MKSDGISDVADNDKGGADLPIPIRRGESEQWAVVLKKLLDEREAQIADLRSKVEYLEQNSAEQHALRQQSEQALTLTRRRLTSLLDENAERKEQAEEARQTLQELAASAERVGALEAQLSELLSLKRELETRVADLDEWTFKLAADRRTAEDAQRKMQSALNLQKKAQEVAKAEIGALKADISRLKDQSKESEGRRDEAYCEIAAITRLLKASETLSGQLTDRMEWLARVASIAAGHSRRWHRLLPAVVSRRMVFRRLAAARLFDADAYLARYPDVRQAKEDPLRHYILHGMTEGRQI